MADDDGQTATNLANVGVILVALVLVSIFFFPKEQRLVSSRPANFEEAAPEQSSARIDSTIARPWQDPLAAVAKSVDRLGRGDLDKRCVENPNNESICTSPLTEKDRATLVLGVMVSEAPYSEDAERRRRTRYAVSAGLQQVGFLPSDPRHINFFLWKQNVPARPASPPTSTSVPLPAEKGPTPVLHSPLAGKRTPEESGVANSAPTPRVVVPFERFVGREGQVLVLWLSEEALGDQPFQKISELRMFLQQPEGKTEWAKHINIIGPWSSGTLLNMLKESLTTDYKSYSQECETNAKQGDRQGLNFYAYGASLGDEFLISQLSKNYPAQTEAFFRKNCITVQRTIATDRVIARGIVRELSRRLQDLCKDHVLLAYESDALPSQALMAEIKRELTLKENCWRGRDT